MSAQVENPSEAGSVRADHLTRFQPGKSGNPGGLPRGVEKISIAYQRLLKLDYDDLQAYRPKTVSEAIAYRQIGTALFGLEALPSVKEITDRTEGKSRETKDVTSTVRIQVVFDEQPGSQDDSSETPALAPEPASDSEDFETVQCAGVWEALR